MEQWKEKLARWLVITNPFEDDEAFIRQVRSAVRLQQNDLESQLKHEEQMADRVRDELDEALTNVRYYKSQAYNAEQALAKILDDLFDVDAMAKHLFTEDFSEDVDAYKAQYEELDEKLDEIKRTCEKWL